MVLNNGCVVEMQMFLVLVVYLQYGYICILIVELFKLWLIIVVKVEVCQVVCLIMFVKGVVKVYEVCCCGQMGKLLVQVVCNVDFDVYQGDNFGVVGEFGCGKFLLMWFLMGFECFDVGQIEFEGEDVGVVFVKCLCEMWCQFQFVLQDFYGLLLL